MLVYISKVATVVAVSELLSLPPFAGSSAEELVNFSSAIRLAAQLSMAARMLDGFHCWTAGREGTPMQGPRLA